MKKDLWSLYHIFPFKSILNSLFFEIVLTANLSHMVDFSRKLW